MKNDNHQNQTGVIVVGGGLAGLTTAAYLAKAGQSVMVLEQAHQLGGRAVTRLKDGFYFNVGPHALYRDDAGMKVLQELGVKVNGGVPAVAGYAIKGGKRYPFPGQPVKLVASPILSVKAKIEVSRFLLELGKINPAGLEGISLATWLNKQVQSHSGRQLLEALFRLSTYVNCPNELSAGSALVQLQMGLTKGVLYLDYGWQSLVNSLRDMAIANGTEIISSARASRIELDSALTARGVHLADGRYFTAEAVVIAAGPKVAAELIPHSAGPMLRQWADTAIPVKAACLDVALTDLPNPAGTFALGIDEPLYLSAHSAVANLAPLGGQVIHVAKYLSPYETPDSDKNRHLLETTLDLAQPGWRERLVHSRFLPHVTVMSAIPTAKMGGTAGRLGPGPLGIKNLYLAGDWIGSQGLLADASFASAKQAAQLILAQAQRRLSEQFPVLEPDMV